MKKKSRYRFFWYAIAIGIGIFFILVLLSTVMDVGEKLGKINKWVEYGFYVLAVVLFWFLIVNPIRVILFSPSFTIETNMEDQKISNYRVYKMVRHQLVNSTVLPQEEKNLLHEAVSREELRAALAHSFDLYIKKEINLIIKKSAKTVMISTAISQSGRLDSLTIVAVNLQMIKNIVSVSGFRPNLTHLSKLVVNIFFTALIAEGLENMNLNDILPNSAMNMLGEIPLVKPVISSLVQGITNALLTLRVGFVTRRYLYDDSGDITKEKIRQGAFVEAIGLLPVVISEVLVQIPGNVLKIFGIDLTKKNPPKPKVSDIAVS
jgi:hypothetical protein